MTFPIMRTHRGSPSGWIRQATATSPGKVGLQQLPCPGSLPNQFNAQVRLSFQAPLGGLDLLSGPEPSTSSVRLTSFKGRLFHVSHKTTVKHSLTASSGYFTSLGAQRCPRLSYPSSSGNKFIRYSETRTRDTCPTHPETCLCQQIGHPHGLPRCFKLTLRIST